MEIQLKSGGAMMSVVLEGKTYPLKKPRLKAIKKIEDEKRKPKEESDMIGVIESILLESGLPQEVFDNLDMDQFAEIMNGFQEMMASKKNLAPPSL